MKTKTLIGIVIAVGVLLIAVVLWNRPKTTEPITPGTGSNEPACTMEAMICPDGSVVGRVPPTCEFAACPTSSATSTTSTLPTPPATSTTSTPPIGWVSTTTVDGIRYSYPAKLSTTYVSAAEWPPTVTRQRNTAFSCKLTGAITATVNGRSYCVTRQAEGAAGSTYTTHSYRFTKGDDLETLTFTLRTVQCLNYDEPEQSACQREQANFDPNGFADQIAQTVTHS